MTTLSIQMTPAEGSLQRIIGLIERRGFRIGALHMPQGAQDAADIAVTVIPRDDTRCVDILSRQIQRLIEVNTVSSMARTNDVIAMHDQAQSGGHQP